MTSESIRTYSRNGSVERAAHGMSGETACVPTLVGARKRGVHATPTTRQILSGYRWPA